MEEFASLWSYQENTDELKQKLLYTTLELQAVKAETEEEMKRNTESIKQLLHLLKIACQERDEANDQLQKLINKTMIKGKTLPQKGKLLQAVTEAGPLLHSLLLAGLLPSWRNPPPLKAFHIPSMVATADQITAAPINLSKSPMMMLQQSEPFTKMGCGGFSQMVAVGGGGGDTSGGGVLSFGDVNFGSNYQGRMMAASPSANTFGTIGKRQRLH